MSISDRTKAVAARVLSVFETGSPRFNYAQVSSEGKGELSYGMLQAYSKNTSRDLSGLLRYYASLGGQYASAAKTYADRLDSGTWQPYYDQAFKDWLKQAATDPVMVKAQSDWFVGGVGPYWRTAERLASKYGLEKPLSHLAMFDAAIQGYPSYVRTPVDSQLTPPSQGGSEDDWLRGYLRIRRNVFQGKGGLLAKSTYRIDTMEGLLNQGNWDLNVPIQIPRFGATIGEDIVREAQAAVAMVASRPMIIGGSTAAVLGAAGLVVSLVHPKAPTWLPVASGALGLTGVGLLIAAFTE